MKLFLLVILLLLLNTSPATRRMNMENSNLNKSMFEEIFGGELEVMEKAPEPFKSDKSQVRQYRDWLHEGNESARQSSYSDVSSQYLRLS